MVRHRLVPTRTSIGFSLAPDVAEGIAGMRVGGRRQLVVPGHLGYGSRGAAPAIPPNALLHFDVELVSIHQPGGWFGRLVSLAKALPLK